MKTIDNHEAVGVGIPFEELQVGNEFIFRSANVRVLGEAFVDQNSDKLLPLVEVDMVLPCGTVRDTTRALLLGAPEVADCEPERYLPRPESHLPFAIQTLAKRSVSSQVLIFS